MMSRRRRVWTLSTEAPKVTWIGLKKPKNGESNGHLGILKIHKIFKKTKACKIR
jgi:hypothetical protein